MNLLLVLLPLLFTVADAFSDPEQDYCKCVTSSIWLDVVFLVDSSNEMGKMGLQNVEALIQGTLYQMSLGDASLHSRVGIIAYATNSSTIYDFDHLQSADDIDNIDVPYYGGAETNIEECFKMVCFYCCAIKDAVSLLDLPSHSRVAQKVIVLIGSSYNKGSSNDPKLAANEFKENGGTIMAIDYVQPGGIADFLLADLSSSGYFFTNSNGNFTANDLLQSLCQVNCYCAPNLRVFTRNPSQPDLPSGGCYDAVTLSSGEPAAQLDCSRKNGFLSTVHDADKKTFLNSLYGPKIRQWLGVKYFSTNGTLWWADGSNDSSTDWAAGQPSEAGECVFLQQYQGFNSGWFSADCKRQQMNYACQIQPCDSTFDCVNKSLK